MRQIIKEALNANVIAKVKEKYVHKELSINLETNDGKPGKVIVVIQRMTPVEMNSYTWVEVPFKLVAVRGADAVYNSARLERKLDTFFKNYYSLDTVSNMILPRNWSEEVRILD